MRDPVYPVERRRRRSFAGRFLLWLGLTVCLLIVAAFFSTPWILRHAVPRVFAEHGLQASVQGGRIGLLRGELTLRGLALGERGAPALAFDEVGVGIDLAALVRGRLAVERLRVEGVELDPKRLGSLYRRGATGSADAVGVLPAELELDDVRLSMLSERVGQDVRVRHLVVRDLARLAASGKASVVADVSVAGAPVGVRAELALQGNDLSLSGRYKADGVALTGWSAMWSDAGASIDGGILHAAGTLTGDYRTDTRRVELVLDGNARASDVGARIAAARVSGVDLSWNGALTITWPSLDSAPTLSGDGELGVEHAEVELDAGTATLSDAAWRGSVHWSGGGRAEGTVRGDRIELSGAGNERLTMDDFTWRMRIVHSRSPDTVSVLAEDLSLSRAVFAVYGEDAVVEGGADRVSVDEFRAAHTGDFVIGQVHAEAIWSAESDAGASGAARGSWRARDLSLEGLSGILSGDLQIARASAATVGVDAGDRSMNLDRVHLVTLGYRHPGQVGAETLAIDSARVEVNGEEIWLESIDASRLYRERAGHAGADMARAASIYQVAAPHGSWEASRVALHGIERDPAGSLRSATLEVEELGHSDTGTSWTARKLRGTELTSSPGDGTLEAAAVTLAGIEGSEPSLGALALNGVEGNGLSLSSGGAALISARADSLALRDTRGARYRAHALSAARMEASRAAGLRAERLEAERLEGALAGAGRHAGSGLRLDRLAVDSSGALALGAARLESFSHASADTHVVLDGISAERLHRPPGGAYSLDEARVARVDVEGAPSGAFALAQLEAGDLVWDGGAQLDAARAFAATVHGAAKRPWRALAVTAHELSYRVPAALHASAMQIETLRDDAEPPSWELDGLAAEQVRIDDATGHSVASLRAGALDFRDARSSAAFKRAELEELRVGDGVVVGAARASAVGISLAAADGSSPARFDAQVLELAAPRLTHAGLLDLGDVVVRDAALTLGRGGHEQWIMPPLPGAGAQPPAGGLRVASLATRGAGRLEYFDRETTPVYRTVLEPMVFALSGLDTSLPGNTAEFRLMALDDSFAHANVSGRLVTGVENLDLDVHGRVTGVSAVDFNPFVMQREPFRVTAGHADMSVDFAVHDGRMTGDAKVSLSGLKVQRATGPVSSLRIDNGQLPLNTAIKLLQDPGGNIDVVVPLATRTDVSGFDFIETLVSGTDTTMRAAANLPEKAMNRTLGLVESVISLLPGLDASTYPPVMFAPGSAALQAPAMEYLIAIADRLLKRAEMGARVCPVVLPREAEVLRRAAAADSALFASARAGVFDAPASPEALAERRAAEVRRYLESEGIGAKRLRECVARADGRADAEPRVEIEMERSR